jgi:hypothetical protein
MPPLHPLTASLAVLVGLYMVALGIGAFVAGRDWTALLEEFEHSQALVALTGIIAFAIGGAIVTLHNRWTDPVAIIVTLAGWIAVIEGLAILAVPRWYLALSRRIIAAPRVWGAVMLALGAFLLSSVLASPFARML